MKNLMHCGIFALLVISMAAMSFTPAPTGNGDFAAWTLLGLRKVNYALDHDEIVVTAKEGTFTKLKMKVKGGPINMHKMVVHFGNGEKQEIELRQNITAGGETRVIDLPGNSRVITKVDMWYDTKNLARRKAVVELWGKH